MNIPGHMIAHRGVFDNKSIPENSMLAFQKALDLNYNIELDVQLTKDSVLVVFHDESLERMCHDNRLVQECTYQELRKLKLLDTKERIPTLKEVLDLGLYIGLDGPVTYKNAKTPKEVAKIVPLDRLLFETDSPYLTPHPFRGKPNSPKYLPLIAEEIAALRNVDVSLIEESTSKNAKKLFKI